MSGLSLTKLKKDKIMRKGELRVPYISAANDLFTFCKKRLLKKIQTIGIALLSKMKIRTLRCSSV